MFPSPVSQPHKRTQVTSRSCSSRRQPASSKSIPAVSLCQARCHPHWTWPSRATDIAGSQGDTGWWVCPWPSPDLATCSPGLAVCPRRAWAECCGLRAGRGRPMCPRSLAAVALVCPVQSGQAPTGKGCLTRAAWADRALGLGSGARCTPLGAVRPHPQLLQIWGRGVAHLTHPGHKGWCFP